MNLNQVTFPVDDMDAACEFYQALGCVRIVDADHYARFECPEGDATFSLTKVERMPSNPTVIYFECEDLDATVKGLERKGIVFDQSPRDQSWLWREAICHDPSGNKVKLYWAGENRKFPPWRVGKKKP